MTYNGGYAIKRNQTKPNQPFNRAGVSPSGSVSCHGKQFFWSIASLYRVYGQCKCHWQVDKISCDLHQVFLSNTNNFQTDLFNPLIGP